MPAAISTDPLYYTAPQLAARHAAPAPVKPTARANDALGASELAVHEALHAVVARRLGLPVGCIVIGASGGTTLIVHGPEPDQLQKAAVATAAGVVFDRKLGLDPAGYEDDLCRVNDLCRRYRDAAGHEMPDPFGDAAAMFRDPTLTAPVRAIALLLDIKSEASQADVDALIEVNAPPPPAATVADHTDYAI